MNALGSLATIALIAAAVGGCAHAGEDSAPEEAPAEDEPLELGVDSLDLVHGALRLTATMVDGAADVSISLGGDCEHREVGGGLSTRSTLVWTLGEADVAESIGCGLAVHARAWDDGRRVNKVAALEVAVDMAAAEGENPEDGPQLQAIAASTEGVGVVFTAVPASAHLTTGDSILEPAPAGSPEGDPAADDGTGRFTVPRLDFARSVLRQRPLRLSGSSFVATLSVAGTAVENEPPGPIEISTEAPEETTSDEVEESAPEEIPAEEPGEYEVEAPDPE